MIIRNCKAYLGGLQVNPQSATLRLMTVRVWLINVATLLAWISTKVMRLILYEASLKTLCLSAVSGHKRVQVFLRLLCHC